VGVRRGRKGEEEREAANQKEEKETEKMSRRGERLAQGIMEAP
jgi:hypothetical protein